MMSAESPQNLFAHLPADLTAEVFEPIINHPGSHGPLRLERIISYGHTSPATGWYDQPQQEWVLVLQGEAVLGFADKPSVRLCPGDYLNIPAHCQHRVEWTDPQQPTIWLAIHYG